MPRHRGSKRPPHRNSTRKGTRPRDHLTKEIANHPLIGMLRESLRISPLHFAATVLYLTETEEAFADLAEAEPLRLVDTFLEFDMAETTNALHVLASTTSDDVLAARIRQVLEGRRQPVDSILRDFGQVEVVEVLHAGADHLDGEHIAPLLRWPDGSEAALMVMIKFGEHSDYIGDAFLMESSHAEAREALERMADVHGLTLESMSLGQAARDLSEFFLAFAELEPDESLMTDTWPVLAGLLLYVVNTMPVPEGEELQTCVCGQCQSNDPIAVPEPPTEAVISRIRVEIEDTEPLVWRELEVRSDLSLAEFSQVLNEAVGWDNSHLHRFWPGDAAAYGEPYFTSDFDEAEGHSGTPEYRVRLDQVLLAPGDQLFYEYDFGDSWGHLITLLGTRPVTDTDDRAVCLTGDRLGPLEDIGGVHRHNELVAALDRPGGRWSLSPELREWVGEGYDPAAFDVDQVNIALGLIGRTLSGALASAERASGGDLSLAEGLMLVIAKVPERLALDVVVLVEKAIRRERPEVTEAGTRSALPQVYTLLEEAAASPIPLTQAGWIKPAVVVRLAAALGLDQSSYGKNNREQNVLPLHWLRTGLGEVGLLRKIKGRLEITAAGQRALRDPEALVRQISSRIARTRKGFDQQARAMYLLHLAAGDETGAIGAVTDLLDAAGWQMDGGRLSRYPVHRATDATRALLGGVLGDAPEDASVELFSLIARDAVIAID